MEKKNPIEEARRYYDRAFDQRMQGRVYEFDYNDFFTPTEWQELNSETQNA